MGGALSPAEAALKRSAWLKTLLQWHWISSAICLVALVLFSLTGITLNNAGLFESKAKVQRLDAQLPERLRAQLQAAGPAGPPSLPAEVAAWLEDLWALELAGRVVEWSGDEAYLAMPRPGGDAWLRIDLASGAAEAELSDRGWVAYFNDLHKGRHAGRVWSWFLDLFAGACLLFALTGLWILKLHALKRPSTWPMVALGLLLPLLLLLLFVH
ncbi:hypothetical protein HNP55_003185 [Paucibacter oligotrophus]|uniref:PepSY-associated transmembrane protein n=1 Tax=Roseateles oligotrophus TaxID=1769250 RepID=A0A840LA65_9BURK|nr:PepSY-associated TM helix domain-containing protein [Roseateles oligotrophus]MBB4844641.1 hypothetical protein [Roseateles oligotrophus]